MNIHIISHTPTVSHPRHQFLVHPRTSLGISPSRHDKPSIPVTHTVAMAVRYRTQDLTHHLHCIFLGVSSPSQDGLGARAWFWKGLELMGRTSKTHGFQQINSVNHTQSTGGKRDELWVKRKPRIRGPIPTPSCFFAKASNKSGPLSFSITSSKRVGSS